MPNNDYIETDLEIERMTNATIEYQEHQLVEAQNMLDLSISQLESVQGQIKAYNERIKYLRKELASLKGENQ
ncbi:MAG: hypothetical protein ACRCX2_38490 [Paraclostridium sp.]